MQLDEYKIHMPTELPAVLDLVPGTNEVICPVGSHKMLGMRLELTVTK